jgi:PPOX class probable F420-dependent enzyme
MNAGSELKGARYLSLGTFRKTGVRVATPVWFAESNGKFYVFSEGKAGKVKRLRNSSRAEVAACNYSGKLKGDWVAAQARIVEDQALIEVAHNALISKYGWQMKTLDFFSGLAGKKNQRAFIEVEASPRER